MNLSKKANLIIIILIAFLIAVFHYKIKNPPTTEDKKEFTGNFTSSVSFIENFPANFELELISGEKFVLADNIGEKIIILNFFATWCGPCIAELPELNRYYLNAKEEGLPVVLIAVNALENEELVNAFIQKHKPEFPVGIDKDGDILEKYGVKSYPTTVLIGVDGKIQLYETGKISNADIAFGPAVKKELIKLEKGRGIDKESFLQLSQAAQSMKQMESEEAMALKLSESLKKEEENIILKGKAARMAEKINSNCCGPVSKCHSSQAKKIRKRLSEIEDIDNKTDEEILRILFILSPEEQL